ncbi:LuxR family transcriptional regulator, partial [uncultured Nocardioides sp.]
RIFGSRVLRLPGETRELLLVAALGQDDVVLPFPDWSHRERALAPARELGLVRLEGGQGQVVFRHPLVRATVVELSTSAERRRAHQVLAAAYQAGDDRAAWHLAAATVTPDEEVAELLERAAQRAWRRGDAVGAVRTLVHAAEMSPPGRARARRFAAAAYQGADVVGDLDGASRLMRNAEATEVGTPQSLQAATVTAYLLLNGSGDTRTAHRVLVEALQATVEVSGAEEQMLVEAVHNLCEISLYADDPELWSAFRSALARAPLARYPVLDLWVGLVVDPVRTGAAVLADLEVALDSLVTETDPVRVERVATAAIFVDRVTRARGPLLRLADDARAGGTVTSGIMALMLLSLEAFQDGDWDSARSWGVEGLAWCRQHGFDLLSWPLQLTQALLAAGRGDSAGVQSLTDRMRSWATPRQVGAVLQYAAHATALDALGRGDHETAFRAVSAISAPGELRAHCGHALWVPLLLVEAAVHAGHAEAARAHVAAMEAAGVGELSPRLALRVNGARAIAAPQLDRELFDRALRTPQARASPFELARIQLRYGQRLRRARAATEARSHLQDALVTFGRLGAAPWVAATEEELRATGPVKDLSRPGTTPAGLTPQEHRVANLAAAGLSNRQIGERLLISARTVGAHLQGAFGKLAVHNRAGLTDALSQHQDGADPALSRPDVGAGSGGQA